MMLGAPGASAPQYGQGGLPGHRRGSAGQSCHPGHLQRPL